MNSDSFQITGRCWIKPDGSVIDTSDDEHARIARGVMLGIPEDEIRRTIHLDGMFSPLAPEQARYWLERGAHPEAVAFLCLPSGESIDPRLWAIREWSWIRQRGNAFYAWIWTLEAKSILSNSDDFWKRQTKVTGQTWATLYNVVDSASEEGTLRSLGIERFSG